MEDRALPGGLGAGDGRIVLTGILFALVVVSAWFDVARSRIPDAITLPALGAGLALSGLAGGLSGSAPCLRDAVLGALLGGGLLAVPWMLGGMGPGDVKLMAAVGALAGVSLALRALVLSALAGAAMGLGSVILKGRLAETLGRTLRLAALRPLPAGGRPPVTIPFGLAIGIGTTWAILLEQGVIP